MTEHELLVLQLIADGLDGHAAQFIDNAIDCIRSHNKRITALSDKLEEAASIESILVSIVRGLDGAWLSYSNTPTEEASNQLNEQRRRMHELLSHIEKPSI